MREIKFRAWDNQNQKWATDNDVSETASIGLEFGIKDWFINIAGERAVRWSFMQFTGLHDKNGKEIYEGDILMYSSDGYAYNNGDVIFSDGCFTCRGTFFRQLSIAVCPLFKIIGNIYEHPELLTDKTNANA